ncbi:MAG: DUF6134 family protein [Vicinamibacterales bacterium]
MLFVLLAWPMFVGPLAAGQQIAGFPSTSRLEYSVTRNGERIGTQTVEFRVDQDKYIVRIRADISVKVLFDVITAYRLKHMSEEIWTDGQLVSLTSRTDDNGKRKVLDVRKEGDVLKINYNGKESELPGSSIPASFWHPDTMRQSLLLDPVSGKPRRISIAEKAGETIDLGGAAIAGRHYSITGEIMREVWYGPKGNLIRYSFPAKDGSTIWVTLRCPQEQQMACK